jgi:hypothetical protein
MKTIDQLRKESNLPKVNMSAAELRRTNPELAKRYAAFFESNKDALVAALSKQLAKS